LQQYPDFSKELCIITYASKKACGAVLTQNYNELQLPIAYASRAFTKRESNKCKTEQELATIHWGIGTKGKWKYASSKARLKCATYPRSQHMVMAL